MKFVTPFLLMFVASTSVFGQQNKFDIGVEGGPSLIFLRGNIILDTLHSPTAGLSCGAFFQFNFPKIFSLRTNIAFERKGSYVSSSVGLADSLGNFVGSYPYTYRSKFEYLTIPVLLRASFGKKTRFFVNAGPFFGFLLKMHEVYNISGYPTYTNDFTEGFKRVDIGVTVGAGVEIPIKENWTIFCEIRNNLGLYNTSDLPVVNDGTIKTNSTNLLVGFSYRLGKRELKGTNENW